VRPRVQVVRDVVGEDALERGDTEKAPRFVQTVPHIRYRLVAGGDAAIDCPRAIRERSTAAGVGLYALTAISAALIALAFGHRYYDKFVDRPARVSSRG
jgi:hypothetical protein